MSIIKEFYQEWEAVVSAIANKKNYNWSRFVEIIDSTAANVMSSAEGTYDLLKSIEQPLRNVFTEEGMTTIVNYPSNKEINILKDHIDSYYRARTLSRKLQVLDSILSVINGRTAIIKFGRFHLSDEDIDYIVKTRIKLSSLNWRMKIDSH